MSTMLGHAHQPKRGRTLARPLGRTRGDSPTLDAIQQTLATVDLDAVALAKIEDLVRATGREVPPRDRHYMEDERR